MTENVNQIESFYQLLTEWYKYPSWVAVVIALFSVIVGFIIASLQIRHSRDVAKKSKAIEILLAQEQDLIHENGLSVLNKYKRNGKEKLIARLAETHLFTIKIDKQERKKEILILSNINNDGKLKIIENKIKCIYKKKIRRKRNREKLLDLLNYYEYVALGIEKDIICNETMFFANHSTFTWIFKSSKPFIDALQNDQKTIFSEITKLNRKWCERRKLMGFS